MLREVALLAVLVGILVLGCAQPMKCYRISSADSWISGGPSGHHARSRSHDYYGYLSDRTESNGYEWSGEVGVNLHWDSSKCEWTYYEEGGGEEATETETGPDVHDLPGGSGTPTRY
jgi:hypothetical protein